MSNIQINNGHSKITDNYFLFPAGEVGVKLDTQNLAFWKNPSDTFTIEARVQNSNDLFRIALVKDAIERMVGYGHKINLFMPYVAYARQDRVCVAGEPHSLKVFCDYINGLNFNEVKVVDPHSLVTEALLNKVKIVSQLSLFQNNQELKRFVFNNAPIFVSPDSGANKKTSEIAAYFQHKNFIRCDKLRELSTGKIKETIVYCDDLLGLDVMIVDDIIDGGATFTFLAKELKKKKCGKIYLFATHGIFSKGVGALLDCGIDHIWTTNSYQERPLGNYDANKINIIDL